MKTRTALYYAQGTTGHGHAPLKVGDATQLTRAADDVLARRGDTFRLPHPLNDKRGCPKAEREARLRAMALKFGEYKVKH